MIEVGLFADLADRAKSRSRHLSVRFQPGLTVGDIIREEGLAEADVRVILVNGRHAGPTTQLRDGDRVSLFPAIGGG